MAINLYQKWAQCKKDASAIPNGSGSRGLCYSSFSLARFGCIFISVDGAGSESLYIELDDDTADNFERPDIRGMLFSVDKILDLDATKRFLRISLDSQSSLPEAFEAFSVTVARTLATVENSSEAVEVVLEIVEKYLAFFGKGGRRVLSASEEQGLFGELLVLEKALSVFGDKSINAWTGPDKNKHDFIFKNNDSIEVKTSLKQTRISVKISNENQLSFAPGSNLYLKILALEVNPSGQTVVDLINHLLNDCIVSENAKTDFKMKLLEMGIDAELVQARRHYVLVGTHTYHVDDSFPRLTLETVRGVSTRIYNLTYCLDLDGVEEEGGNIYERLGC